MALPAGLGIVGPAGGGSGGTPHRAWCVLITQNDGSASFCGMTELELRGSAGGADLTSPSEIIRAGASTTINSDNPASAAFNDDFATGWLSSTSGASRIWWDFGAGGGASKYVAQIAITGSWNAPDASPQDFELQWTDDDPTGTPTWTTAGSWEGETGWTGADDTRVFTVE